MTLTLALAIAIAAAVISNILLHTGHENRLMVLAVAVAAAVLPLTVGQSMFAAALQGIHRVVTAQIPAILVQPLLFLTIIVTAILLFPDKLAVVETMGAYLISVLLALCLTVILWHRYRPAALIRAKAHYEFGRWLTAAVPMFIITLTMTINWRADLLMLGWLGKPADIGIYAAAARAAELVLFITQSINIALSPAVAAFSGTGAKERLQRVFTETTRVGFALTCIVSLLIILLGTWYLNLFGSDFLRGETALWILLGGQIVNAAFGAVGVMLIMSGFERSASIATIAGALTNLGLNAIWIPRYGIEGAAMATLAGTIVWNTLLAWYVSRRIGLRTGLFGTRKAAAGK
jgi:O-antigen/teichoic acid export membrane protein